MKRKRVRRQAKEVSAYKRENVRGRTPRPHQRRGQLDGVRRVACDARRPLSRGAPVDKYSHWTVLEITGGGKALHFVEVAEMVPLSAPWHRAARQEEECGCRERHASVRRHQRPEIRYSNS